MFCTSQATKGDSNFSIGVDHLRSSDLIANFLPPKVQGLVNGITAEVGPVPMFPHFATNQGRKSLRPCLARLRVRWFDSIAQTSELPNHSPCALILALFGDCRAPFFVTGS